MQRVPDKLCIVLYSSTGKSAKLYWGAHFLVRRICTRKKDYRRLNTLKSRKTSLVAVFASCNIVNVRTYNNLVETRVRALNDGENWFILYTHFIHQEIALKTNLLFNYSCVVFPWIIFFHFLQPIAYNKTCFFACIYTYTDMQCLANYIYVSHINKIKSSTWFLLCLYTVFIAARSNFSGRPCCMRFTHFTIDCRKVNFPYRYSSSNIV